MYISSLAISGYRSLKNVEIKEMLPVVIFHGLNNSGKSNILSAIETIFRRKVVVEETTTADETKKLQRTGNFYQGRITDFRDNFYLNGRQDIIFSVSVTLTDSETAPFNEILKLLNPALTKTGGKKIVLFDGRMKYRDENSAEMILDRVMFKSSDVVFEVEKSGKKTFFPTVKGLTEEVRVAQFEKLMELFSDSFALLQADRYLTMEKEGQDSGAKIMLTPKTFKQWLHKLSLDRSTYESFEEIKKMIASKPFEFGDIGFSKEGDEIEIMVKTGNVRLPICRLGSGHQQILYIIGSLVLYKKRMVGIEELEINLSPTAQKNVFEKLKHHIFTSADLINQLIITSHSDTFGNRGDVRVYGVEHNGQETLVHRWTQADNKKHFGPTGGWDWD
ncbi:MAG: AAA family ATPase [Verrucomicrobiia bacterium]|jgi:predicted ATPase